MNPATPRLREAHAHIAQHGRAMTMLDLSDCRGVADCLERVGSPALGSSSWLLGHGVRVESWSDPPAPRWPTAVELDQAVGDRPCCLWSFDHHALVVNTAGLRGARITDSTPDPAHGRIVRDERGRPTGLMLESAAKLVWRLIPEPTGEERLEMVAAGAADLARFGFVEVNDLLSEPWLGPVLAALDDAGRLPVRVSMFPRLEDLDAVLASRARFERPGVRLAGAKLFADGTLNARTASMLHPYADPLPGLPRGEAMLTRDQIADALRRTSSLGLTLAVHAIGDAAVRTCLDAAEGVRDEEAKRRRDGVETEGSSSSQRLSVSPSLRIEHAEIIDAADVPRFAVLGVVCSVQPCHLLADVEALRRGLPHRLDRVLPLRDLIDSGCTPDGLLQFGSDAPIVRPDPEDSIQAATQRRRSGAPSSDAIAPRQAIHEHEAWTAFQPVASSHTTRIGRQA